MFKKMFFYKKEKKEKKFLEIFNNISIMEIIVWLAIFLVFSTAVMGLITII